MAAKNKGLSISINKDEVMYTNISKSKDGYNSARVVVKRGDKEYMSISYEWEGDGVPGFAMDLMGFMQASEIKPNTILDEKAYVEFLSREESAMPPWIKDKKDDKDKDKKGKDKKGKDKKDKKGKKKTKEDSDLEDE